MNILLLEDDQKTASFIVRGFSELGYLVDHHVDGGDGLAKALDGNFGAMIIDRMLPTVSGLSIIRTLREQGLRTPILMLTALSAVEERVEGLEAGADDYLGKPFAFSELLAGACAAAAQCRGTQREF